jgi:hypothetical protein
MKKTFKMLLVSVVFINLFSNAQNAAQAQSTAWQTVTNAVQENIVAPALDYIERQGGIQNIALESFNEGKEWAQERYNALKEDARAKVSYLINEFPQDAHDMLSEEEWNLVKEKLNNLKTEAAAYNTQAAEYFGLPENIMGGILLALGLLGVKRATVPAIKAAVPLLGDAVEYGALAGAGYSAYKALQVPLSELPAYASKNTIKAVLESLKDWAIDTNRALAGKLSVPPYVTGGVAVGIGALGARSVVSTIKSALYWGRMSLYLAIAWPVLRWTYEFTNQALERLETRRATKAQAQGLLSAAEQALDNAESIAQEILKDEL